MATSYNAETQLLLHRREALRLQFAHDVASGAARPYVLPFDFLGSVTLPIVYLCIPHTRRPWIYRMRFVVVGVMVWLNVNMLMTASSMTFAAAYFAGLSATWGTIWGLTLLVWTRPQFEAERVERRLTRLEERHAAAPRHNGHANGLAQRKHVNGKVKGQEHEPKSTVHISDTDTPDETVAASLAAGYTYYWQSYPSDSSLPVRLEWVLDYALSFRGTGWSTTSIPSVPAFKRPDKPLSESPVDLASIPLRTPTGFSRYTTLRSFLANRLGRTLLSYVMVDVCAFAIEHDPYFILGPDYASVHPLPPHLASLHPFVLSLFRSTLSLTVIANTVNLIVSTWQIVQVLLFSCSATLSRLVGARAELWHYPDVFGGFVTNVLDYGLAGFWGGWWHQTLRGGFVAPTNWMASKGWLPASRRHPVRRFVGAVVAFVLSASIHAGGSYTAVSKETRWWNSALFFLLNLLGVIVQAAWDVIVPKEVRGRCPLWVRRAANLVFVAAWLHATQWLFVQDLARGGVWLFEPVPFSFVRALAFGGNGPGDQPLRWGWEDVPRLWTGGRWWEMGIAP